MQGRASLTSKFDKRDAIYHLFYRHVKCSVKSLKCTESPSIFLSYRWYLLLMNENCSTTQYPNFQANAKKLTNIWKGELFCSPSQVSRWTQSKYHINWISNRNLGFNMCYRSPQLPFFSLWLPSWLVTVRMPACRGSTEHDDTKRKINNHVNGETDVGKDPH